MIVKLSGQPNITSVTYKGFQMSPDDLNLVRHAPELLGTSKFWKYVLTALNPVQAIIVRNADKQIQTDNAITTRDINAVIDYNVDRTLQTVADDPTKNPYYKPATTTAPAKKTNVAAFAIPAALITAAGFFVK
jgi:hypothetical protein